MNSIFKYKRSHNFSYQFNHPNTETVLFVHQIFRPFPETLTKAVPKALCLHSLLDRQQFFQEFRYAKQHQVRCIHFLCNVDSGNILIRTLSLPFLHLLLKIKTILRYFVKYFSPCHCSIYLHKPCPHVVSFFEKLRVLTHCLFFRKTAWHLKFLYFLRFFYVA